MGDDEYAEPDRRKLRSQDNEHEISTRAKSTVKTETDLAFGAEALLGLCDLASLGAQESKIEEKPGIFY